MRIPPRYYAAAGGALFLAMVLSLTVGRFGSSSDDVAPVAIERIAEKNRDAATEAAAVQRSESAASARAAERELDLREAGARGEADADATLARFDNAENHAAAAPPR